MYVCMYVCSRYVCSVVGCKVIRSVGSCGLDRQDYFSVRLKRGQRDDGMEGGGLVGGRNDEGEW